MSDYQRADFSPLAETIYGIGFHWTTWTWGRNGPPKPFEEAVETFDVPAFVAQAVEAGAGHVMITATHELHWLPGPNPEVDRILPGRTCRRDLMMEIADGLAASISSMRKTCSMTAAEVSPLMMLRTRALRRLAVQRCTSSGISVTAATSSVSMTIMNTS